MLELTEEQIAAIEKLHQRTLWGQPHQVHPVFIREALGDGGKLLIVTPIATRPEYYVIRVDSRWADNNDAPGATIGDHIEEVYEAIGNQCGDDFDMESEYDRAATEWPVLCADCGSTWAEYELPAEEAA